MIYISENVRHVYNVHYQIINNKHLKMNQIKKEFDIEVNIYMLDILLKTDDLLFY